METRDEMKDALELVHSRNTFYKKKYYFALMVYIFSLIVVGFLICVIVFLVKNPTHPLYFATDDVGRLIQDPPLSQPAMTTDQAAAWAVEAVEAAHSYDYFNYRA
jgi:hypothetical protein